MLGAGRDGVDLGTWQIGVTNEVIQLLSASQACPCSLVAYLKSASPFPYPTLEYITNTAIHHFCDRDSLCCRGSWHLHPYVHCEIRASSIDLSPFEIIWTGRSQASRAELALPNLEPGRVTPGASTSS